MPKDAPVGDRDGSWIGVNTQIDPTLLPPGLLADGANMRCRTGQPTTRLGRAVYAWANRWDVNGKVLPIENRHVGHWNHDPWHLDYGGNGHELSAGTVFLLPYYMGLYHGYIEKP